MSKKKHKEMPNLTHVKTKKQTVDKKAIADLLAVQQRKDAEHQLEQSLTPVEFTILSAFQKKRLLLDNIWIMVNQSQTSMGGDPISRTTLQETLAKLCVKGYLEKNEVDYQGKKNEVYLLTEKGSNEIL